MLQCKNGVLLRSLAKLKYLHEQTERLGSAATDLLVYYVFAFDQISLER